jgi:heme-degrading monooxygenase HmoA
VSQPAVQTDGPGDEPVTLINAFTVPPEESERFLHRWKDNARIMAGQPGFVRARMYRATADDAELRFVNVAEWASGQALAAATANPEFRASVQRVLDDPDLHVTPRPVVYQVAVDVHPGDPL